MLRTKQTEAFQELITFRVTGDDECLDGFSRDRIGNSNNGYLQQGLELEHLLFEAATTGTSATHFYKVSDAVSDIDEPVLVRNRHIASVASSLSEGSRGLRGLLPIPHGDVRPFGDDLTHLAHAGYFAASG